MKSAKQNSVQSSLCWVKILNYIVKTQWYILGMSTRTLVFDYRSGFDLTNHQLKIFMLITRHKV